MITSCLDIGNDLTYEGITTATELQHRQRLCRTRIGNDLTYEGIATDDTLGKDFQSMEREWRIKREEVISRKRKEAESNAELARQAEEEAKKQALEEEEKQKEEARKKAEWEAMSPEERDLAALTGPEINEQQVFDIFGRIDGFSDENKRRAAAAIKAYWEEHGKWNKKDCSKKQRAKVQHIKEILGGD